MKLQKSAVGIAGTLEVVVAAVIALADNDGDQQTKRERNSASG